MLSIVNEELLEIITKQNQIISQLIKENSEKENLINVLIMEFKD